MTVIENALKKLDKEAKAKIEDRYGKVIKTYVHNAISGFCTQNEEFAKAVLEGGEFTECVKHCTQGIQASSGISDIDVYRRAVQFYFPGATVDFQISIVLGENECLIDDEPQRIDRKKKGQGSKPASKKSVVELSEAAKPQKRSRKQPTQEKIIQLDLFSEEGGLC